MTDRLVFSPAVQERPEPMLSAKEVAAVLGVSLSTFYTIPFFKTRKLRVTDRCVRYSRSDVLLYVRLRTDAA